MRIREGICSKSITVFAALAILITLIYSNTFLSPWHFDDNSNIVKNANIHLTDLQPKSVLKTFYFWNDDTKLYRPAANLSFGLNWYFGQEKVFGYHLVNTIIHIITAFFLYLVCLTILQSKPAAHWSVEKYYIAFFAAALWAAHPIQTQAVTYIVQRMTSLAAMFSIISIYYYLQARITNNTQKRILLFLVSFLFFLLAFSTKETGFLLPGSIVLIEWIFFSTQRVRPNIKTLVVYFASTLLLLLFLGWFIQLFLKINLFHLLSVKGDRLFSVPERLMTEPRVLIFYLSQICYPLSNRFSLEHDFSISTSLTSPWTTLPAIIFILGILFFSIIKRKKYPLLSFAILFYFYNHLIESTIILLELVFEHRNYLPSFFLFLPIVACAAKARQYYRVQKSSLAVLMHSSLIILLIFFAAGTYTRNIVWKTNKSILIDSIHKAPDKSRPYHNLASYLLRKEGDVDKALELYNTALTKQPERTRQSRYQTLVETAKIHTKYRHDYQAAIQSIRQSRQYFPEALTPRKNLATLLTTTGQFQEALDHLQVLLKKRPADYSLKQHEEITRSKLLNMQSLIYLKMDMPKKALISSREAFRLDPDGQTTLANMGMALSRTGQYKEADLIFQTIDTSHQQTRLITFLIMLENTIAGKLHKKSEILSQQIMARFSKKEINELFMHLNNANNLQPVNTTLLQSKLRKRTPEE